MANPASITDYTSLVAAVSEYLLEQDLSATDVPLFISLVEDHANKHLRTLDMMVIATTPLTMTAAQATVPLPADYLETIRLNYESGGQRIPLELVSPQEIINRRDIDVSPPIYYAIVGSTIELSPVPDADYPYYHDYYQRIPALTAIQTTNWLVTKHPTYYLFGCLMEGYRYFKDDPRRSFFEESFLKEAQSIEALDQRARWRPFSRIQRDSYPERRRRY